MLCSLDYLKEAKVRPVQLACADLCAKYATVCHEDRVCAGALWLRSVCLLCAKDLGRILSGKDAHCVSCAGSWKAKAGHHQGMRACFRSLYVEASCVMCISRRLGNMWFRTLVCCYRICCAPAQQRALFCQGSDVAHMRA